MIDSNVQTPGPLDFWARDLRKITSQSGEKQYLVWRAGKATVVSASALLSTDRKLSFSDIKIQTNNLLRESAKREDFKADWLQRNIVIISASLFTLAQLRENKRNRCIMVALRVAAYVLSVIGFLIFGFGYLGYQALKESDRKFTEELRKRRQEIAEIAATQSQSRADLASPSFLGVLQTGQSAKRCAIVSRGKNQGIFDDPKIIGSSDPQNVISLPFAQALETWPKWHATVNGTPVEFPPLPPIPYNSQSDKYPSMGRFIASLSAKLGHQVFNNVCNLHVPGVLKESCDALRLRSGREPTSRVEHVQMDFDDKHLYSTIVIMHTLSGRPPSYVVETLERRIPLDILQKDPSQMDLKDAGSIKTVVQQSQPYAKKKEAMRFRDQQLKRVETLSLLRDPLIHVSNGEGISKQFKLDFQRLETCDLVIKKGSRKPEPLGFRYGKLEGQKEVSEGINSLKESTSAQGETFLKNITYLNPQGIWSKPFSELTQDLRKRSGDQSLCLMNRGMGHPVISVSDASTSCNAVTTFLIYSENAPEKPLGCAVASIKRTFPNELLKKDVDSMELGDLEHAQISLEAEYFQISREASQKLYAAAENLKDEQEKAAALRKAQAAEEQENAQAAKAVKQAEARLAEVRQSWIT